MGQELPTAYVAAGIGHDVVLERRIDRRRRDRAADLEVTVDWPDAVPHDPIRT